MKRSAFTLVEVMVVVMIVSIVTTFAIPNYTKSIERAHRRDAEDNLRMIHATQQVYAARHNNTYWGPGDLNGINNNLGVNIIANGMNYTCAAPTVGPPPTLTPTFSCSAVRGGWTLTITQASTLPTCTGNCNNT